MHSRAVQRASFLGVQDLDTNLAVFSEQRLQLFEQAL
jgi:hypothetical protein